MAVQQRPSRHPLQFPRRPRRRQHEGPEAGFQEIGRSAWRWRSPNTAPATRPRERCARSPACQVPDVTLKRGIIGSLTLYHWLDHTRNGNQNAPRTVTIQLQNEDHAETVQTWKLLRARIVKHTSGPFNAKGSDVAMEELVLAYERLEMESSAQPASPDVPMAALRDRPYRHRQASWSTSATASRSPPRASAK